MKKTIYSTIRFSIVITFLVFSINNIQGQTSLKEIGLNNGRYKVGFLHYTTADSTRTYSRIYDYTNQKIARPISVSVWYPSVQNTAHKKPLDVLDYFEILKAEEEWEYLPNEYLLDWFYYANTPANQNHLKEQTTAHYQMEFAAGKYPVVVYTPSLEASSIENFRLCEYLASHGYVVIASPSRGTETRWFVDPTKENETQARDVEFLIKEVIKISVSDPSNIAVMGFSFGGLANVIAQNRSARIKAIISLDGTERYQFAQLEKSPFFDLNKFDVPYLHMAQKDIPDKVLEEDNINPVFNTRFLLFDSLTKSKAYRFKFHNLTHSYFSTLGVLFKERDIRQDKSDLEIMESYKWVSIYTLNFLNAFLKNDISALEFIENKPSDNGIKSDLLVGQYKKPEKAKFTFQDFNDLAAQQAYENLLPLYETILKKNPSLKLPEGNLNTLGLQLGFNPKTSKQGINVFLLAIHLYPNSANLYDSLAEAYLFWGEKERAIESFKKSLSLNPQNQNAINRLEQLRK